MDAEPTTAKLTQREKEALRGWFDRKTAKEIALDLGISHHAVEKRLKMARVKLGASSSLEAARILAQAEGYGHAVARTSEVSAIAHVRQSKTPLRFTVGAVAMIILAAASLALLQPGSHDPRPADAEERALDTAVNANETKIAQSTRRAFNSLDEDDSGFLEKPESALRKVVMLGPDDAVYPSGTVARSLEAQREETPDPGTLAEFYREVDRDGDGRVSYAEYHDWAMPQLAAIGLELAAGLKSQD